LKILSSTAFRTVIVTIQLSDRHPDIGSKLPKNGADSSKEFRLHPARTENVKSVNQKMLKVAKIELKKFRVDQYLTKSYGIRLMPLF